MNNFLLTMLRYQCEVLLLNVMWAIPCLGTKDGIRIPYLRHMKKSFTSSFNFAMAIAIVSLGLGIFYNPVQQNQYALGRGLQ